MRARRQPLVLLALVNALVLGIGFTAMVDLRRLHTPGGTAKRWAIAAVFGNCPDYLDFSVSDASVSDARSRQQLCQDLRASTADARTDQLKIELVVQHVVRRGTAADVQLLLTRKGVPARVTVHTAEVHGQWRVVRNTLTCGSFGCP